MLQPLPRHTFFLQWLIFLIVVLFVAYLTFESGVLEFIVGGDSTHLSAVILGLMLLGLGHGGLRCHEISRELDSLYTHRHVRSGLVGGATGGITGATATGESLSSGAAASPTLTQNYIDLRLAHMAEGGAAAEADSTLLTVFSERLMAPQDFGWFLVNFVVKLGLLGTVIGFILMLRNVVLVDSVELSDIQVMLVRMTAGMSVALHTTLTGLVVSAILSVQYLWCDHGATRLVADVTFLTESTRTGASVSGRL